MDDPRFDYFIERMDRRDEREQAHWAGEQAHWAEEQAHWAEERNRYERLFERQERSERVFIEAMSEIAAEARRNSERLDDMRESIQANTRAVLSVLDRLEPGTA